MCFRETKIRDNKLKIAYSSICIIYAKKKTFMAFFLGRTYLYATLSKVSRKILKKNTFQITMDSRKTQPYQRRKSSQRLFKFTFWIFLHVGCLFHSLLPWNRSYRYIRELVKDFFSNEFENKSCVYFWY